MRKSAPDTTWPRLARAACDARDWLRVLIPELDRAIAAGRDHDGLLQRLRALAAGHAEALKGALKAPAVPRAHTHADSWRTGGLWQAAEGAEGSHHHPARAGAPQG